MQLRDAIEAMLSARPSRRSVQVLVTEGHKLACAYLSKRRRSASPKPEFFGLSIEDLAFDCIADLFERDSQGVFPKFQQYFGNLSIEDMSDAQLLGTYRKLIFGRIAQRLFEQYRDEDPQLGRLIRNLKHAVGLDPSLDVARRSGQLYITSAGHDRPSRPLMPPELLQFHLLSRLGGDTSTPSILAALTSIFSIETDYRPSAHVSALAQAVRSIHILLSAPLAEESDEPRLEQEEIDLFVSASVRAVQRKMRRTYISRGKVDQNTYRNYFLAIRDILSAQFIRDDVPRSYHDFLLRYIPSLSRESYARDHRCYLEYLTKLSRETLMAQFQREI